MSFKSLLLSVVAGSLLMSMPAGAQMQLGERVPVQLPAGDAKELVESSCAVCHSLTNITNSQGHSPQHCYSNGWSLANLKCGTGGIQTIHEHTCARCL